MKKKDFNIYWEVVVIGSSSDNFVRYAINLLGNCGIRYSHCSDVYCAVEALSKIDCVNGIVIGRFDELNREQGRFFQMAGERGFSCWCLIDSNPQRQWGQVRAAIEAGAFVISKPEQIREAAAKLPVKRAGSPPDEKVSRTACGFIKDEFIASDAELDALLEI